MRFRSGIYLGIYSATTAFIMKVLFVFIYLYLLFLLFFVTVLVAIGVSGGA